MLDHFYHTTVKPARVIILGSNGFVGKSLQLRFKNSNIPYLAVSRDLVDLSSDGSHRNLINIFKPDDAIINLATFKSSNNMDIETYNKNITIAENIIKAVEVVKCQQFIYVSSDAVYPKSEKLITEALVPNPYNLYGSMHLAREGLFKTLCEYYNIPYLVVRPTQIYGIGCNYGSYGPGKMINDAISKQEITLFGEGEELRDFISIDEVVGYLQDLILFRSMGIVNLATGASITFAELADYIATHFVSLIRVNKSTRVHEVWHKKFNVDCLRSYMPCYEYIDWTLSIRKFIHLLAMPSCKSLITH